MFQCGQLLSVAHHQSTVGITTGLKVCYIKSLLCAFNEDTKAMVSRLMTGEDKKLICYKAAHKFLLRQF